MKPWDWHKLLLVTRTTIGVVTVTIVALFISAVVLGQKHSFDDSCISPGSSVGLFGRIMVVSSAIPSLFVIVKLRTQTFMKVLLGVLVLAIVTWFWFWLLRNQDCFLE